MHWLNREKWQTGITVAGVLLFLALIVWGLVSADLLSWIKTNLPTLVVVIGGLIGYFRWSADRKYELAKRRDDQHFERGKRDEERFQSAVAGLEDEKENARTRAAILLRTFLHSGYEQFYTQTFDIVVAYLRLPRTTSPPEDPNAPLPLTTFSQALIVVFKEAFSRVRNLYPQKTGFRASLDASGVQLDNAYLYSADLRSAWMPDASMRVANLNRANLTKTNLSGANLSGADLSGADLSGANIEGTMHLLGAILHDVRGLTKEQLEACEAEGALIDEDYTVSSSQSPASPPPLSQSNDTQAQPAIPAQGNISTPDQETKNTLSNGSTIEGDE